MAVRNPDLSVIFAISSNNVLGDDNTIPWKCKADLQYFKRTTEGHAIIMGRKTWESLPFKPLPGRVNIVVSRQKDYVAVGAVVVDSLEQAISACEDIKMFVIGGRTLLEEAIKIAHRAHITDIGQVIPTNWRTTVIGPDLSRVKKHMVRAQSHPIAETDTCTSAFTKVYTLKN